MGLISQLSWFLLAATPFFESTCLAQSATAVVYTDPATGIVFDTWTVPDAQTEGTMTIGAALPSNALTVDATEFIGLLKCSSQSANNTGWCGLSMGGSMTNSLLLMAWPYNNQILTSFRYATGYVMPDVYTNATLTQISSNITATDYTLIYRCQNCLSWGTGSASTSSAFWLLGWAQNFEAPGNAACPDDVTLSQHDNGQSLFPATIDGNATNAKYSSWAALATKTVTGSCGGSTSTSTPTGTPMPTSVSAVPVPTGSYDYIVIGAGAGGIPIADKLSEAGKSVLLIEKGPPSSGRWASSQSSGISNWAPSWLAGTNLTRFDVPGLCNEIWVDSVNIACQDTDQMAGCVLGGGTAVNAGLWWKPNPIDWDYNFPTGWQSSDMAAATSRVFSRIPGTDHPSKDGQLYYQQGFNVLSNGLKAGGWTSVTANNVPASKNRTYSLTPYMFSNGERGGPMATYLVTAKARKNFSMWTGTSVKRVIRTGGHVTGIEVEAYVNGGYAGVVNVTSITGRVVLSAGTFGSAKLLMRSGIGPADQLAVVQASTDGPTMIGNQSWINLPVGYNLDDHTNTDTVISHPDVVFYDFYAAWTAPNTTDSSNYLNKRTGILAQAAPNIGPMFWDQIVGADGITRQLQWTARVEGSLGAPNGNTMTMSQYLGRGSKSRGRMTISPALNTIVSTVPYLQDTNDVAAVIQGIKNLQKALSGVQGLTWDFPPANETVEDYVNNMAVSYSNRRANHWIGTSKIGTDDGRQAGGTAVVDLNAKVWGTDNLFVVDASIFPGHVTTNPSSYIVTVAERASEKILALAAPVAAAQYSQCGGLQYSGSSVCQAGFTCKFVNAYYWQCL